MGKKLNKKRIAQLLDEAAECWENMGLHFGTRMYNNAHIGWCAVLHPLPIEIDGERVDGPGDSDCIDLLGIIGIFDENSVEDFKMTISEVSIDGKIDGEDLHLELWLYVPEGEEVVDRISTKPPHPPDSTHRMG